MDRLYCHIRRELVAATPEECVRQRVLQHMMSGCGFPSELIAVEKSLRQMPHLHALTQAEIPDRRVDILCFARQASCEGGDLFPLVLTECKAIKLTSETVNQVVGYNYVVRASFVVIVNQEELRTGWYDTKLGEYVFINYLPHFADLLHKRRGV